MSVEPSYSSNIFEALQAAYPQQGKEDNHELIFYKEKKYCHLKIGDPVPAGYKKLNLNTIIDHYKEFAAKQRPKDSQEVERIFKTLAERKTKNAYSGSWKKFWMVLSRIQNWFGSFFDSSCYATSAERAKKIADDAQKKNVEDKKNVEEQKKTDSLLSTDTETPARSTEKKEELQQSDLSLPRVPTASAKDSPASKADAVTISRARQPRPERVAQREEEPIFSGNDLTLSEQQLEALCNERISRLDDLHKRLHNILTTISCLFDDLQKTSGSTFATQTIEHVVVSISVDNPIQQDPNISPKYIITLQPQSGDEHAKKIIEEFWNFAKAAK